MQGSPTYQQLKVIIEQIESRIITLSSLGIKDRGLSQKSTEDVAPPFTPSVEIELNHLIQSVDNLADLLGPSLLTTEIIKDLVDYTWARVSDAIIPLSLATRLNMWSRLWLSWSWQYGKEIWPEQILDLASRRDIRHHVRSINRVSTQLKNDPCWNASALWQRREDFYAEESISYLLSQQSSLKIKLAPLEADLLHGLDLSIKRTTPKSKGWIQFSLSGEADIHLKKSTRLRGSAACCILSPWSLCEYLRTEDHSSNELDGLREALWTALKIPHAKSWSLQTEARALGRAMRHMLGVPLSTLRLAQDQQLRAQETLMKVISIYLDSQVGKKASRPYKVTKRSSFASVTPSFLTTRFSALSIEKN